MLDVAINFLAAQLDAYRRARGNLMPPGQGEPAKPWVVPTRIANDKGELLVAKDSIGVALVNIEEERTAPEQLPDVRRIGTRNVVFEPELRLNLTLLFAASDDGGKAYGDALKSLSMLLTFFQANPSFSPDRHPALDPRITKLSLKLLTPTYEQLNPLWSFVGGKQLPSALYHARMVALQDEQPASVGEPIVEIDQAVGMR